MMRQNFTHCQMEKARKPQVKEAQNLIVMFLAAVLVASALVVGLVFYFGTSKTFTLKSVLVAPKTLEKMVSFEKSDFIYNKIEFVQTERQGKKWGRYPVNLKSYAEFYHIIANTRSTPKIQEVDSAPFDQIIPSTLTIFVRKKENAPHTTSVLQEIQFLEGTDTFRVKFEGKNSQEQWLYFRHPGLYNQIISLFVPR